MTVLKAALALALIASPAVAAPRACPAGLHPATTAELFFGRNVGQEMGVSDEAWRDFLDHEVSTRFSDGLSVTDVYGQWRDTHGQFVHEPSKVIFLVLNGSPDERRNLQAVRDAYSRRFNQSSVLLVQERACVAF
jgi:hypothetical protein